MKRRRETTAPRYVRLQAPPLPTIEQLAATLGMSVRELREAGAAYKRYALSGSAKTSPGTCSARPIALPEDRGQ